MCEQIQQVQRPRGKARSFFRPLMDKEFESKSEAGDEILNLTYPSYTDVSTKPRHPAVSTQRLLSPSPQGPALHLAPSPVRLRQPLASPVSTTVLWGQTAFPTFMVAVLAQSPLFTCEDTPAHGAVVVKLRWSLPPSKDSSSHPVTPKSSPTWTLLHALPSSCCMLKTLWPQGLCPWSSPATFPGTHTPCVLLS